MRRLIKTTIWVLVLAGIIGGTAAWYAQRNGASTVSFRTAAVKRGDLLLTISATGTVEPEEVIDVGAQVAGLINTFGKDVNGKSIDYGSVVEEGTVLAQIDDSLYTAAAAETQAQLQQAKAGVTRAQADLQQFKARLDQATRDWERAQKLGPSDALAQSSYDSYQAAYESAKANVAVGEAAILQANSSVDQAQAVVQRTQRNLSYCTIKSPVKGVIIDRRVNIGQTVVSSLNAPSLFLIAKDLKRMQVWVAVNEADIGSIHPGQPVTFTADAFPGQTFRGEVGKVRLNASMTQNVVTYTVEVTTDNSSGKLLPYLTANVRFEVDRRDNVLQVPNSALRWQPQTEQIAPEAKPTQQANAQDTANNPRHATTRQAADTSASHGVVWVRAGDYVRPIPLRLGITDGSVTELQSTELNEGIEVVIGQTSNGTQTTTTATRNPFLPQMPARSSGRNTASSPGPHPPP